MLKLPVTDVANAIETPESAAVNALAGEIKQCGAVEYDAANDTVAITALEPDGRVPVVTVTKPAKSLPERSRVGLEPAPDPAPIPGDPVPAKWGNETKPVKVGLAMGAKALI